MEYARLQNYSIFPTSIKLKTSQSVFGEQIKFSLTGFGSAKANYFLYDPQTSKINC